LMVGEPNDVYEQEADRMAAAVVSQIHAPQNVSTDRTASIQRQAIGNEGEELQAKPLIQRTSDLGGMAVSSEIESSIQQARGSGQPLAESLRTPMEQAFGADFSGVRVHTGAESDRLNRSIQARAFTTGQDVFFRQGAYQPGTRGGKELIAHELTHVVQQSNDSCQKKPIIQAMMKKIVDYSSSSDSDSESGKKEEKESKKRTNENQHLEEKKESKKRTNKYRNLREAIEKLKQATQLVPAHSDRMLKDDSPELTKILILLVGAVETCEMIRMMPSPSENFFNEEHETFGDFLQSLYAHDEQCVQALESYLTAFVDSVKKNFF
jgi:Domain of unknown function (DUF4157)